MKKFVALIMALGIGLVLAAPAFAKEEGGGKEGDKGSITGELIKKDGGKITVKGAKETLTLVPYWRGGMPKDGGGFDKEMVAKLKTFEPGDHVKVEWTFQEHHRIDSITKLGGGDKPKERGREERK